jgi:hypothetical protein
MVAGRAGGVAVAQPEAEGAQIQAIDEGVDGARRVVPADEIIDSWGEQEGLFTIQSSDEGHGPNLWQSSPIRKRSCFATASKAMRDKLASTVACFASKGGDLQGVFSGGKGGGRGIWALSWWGEWGRIWDGGGRV